MAYVPKKVAPIDVDEMTDEEVAKALCSVFRRYERLGKSDLFSSSASFSKGKVSVCYISYQGTHVVQASVAKAYLKHLLTLSKDDVMPRIWQFKQ